MDVVRAFRIGLIAVVGILAVMMIINFVQQYTGAFAVCGILITGFIAFRLIVHNVRKLMRDKDE